MYASAIQILLSHGVSPQSAERGERRYILVGDQTLPCYDPAEQGDAAME
jgi:hypothetical protein